MPAIADSKLRSRSRDLSALLRPDARASLGDVTETDDGLVINPRALHGGEFLTYSDHRMATAGAIVGLRVIGVLVDNVDTTAKTLPDFTHRWAAMLADTHGPVTRA